MATNETNPNLSTAAVSTSFEGPPTVVEPAPTEVSAPPRGPDPAGTVTEALEVPVPEAATEQGIGIEGEETVWEASYALRNFMGRIVVRGLITLAWLGFAAYAWGYRAENDLSWLVIAFGIGVGIFWLTLIYRMLQAHYGHHYRLTTRRLFVSSGLLHRRRDMMELLSVKDVFTRQSLAQRWMSLGTVVVVSSEHDSPVFYLAGVPDPKEVMDLIWHHARSERDLRSVKIDQV